MTQTDEAFPPFTARPPAQEIWRRARMDYLAGDSAPVIAERYGLSERNLRRRASSEGWRRCDVEAELAPPPPWSRPAPQSRAEFIEARPEYAEIAAAHDADAFFLLFSPERAEFRRYAFRRAAEGAAMKRPSEAASWLRVLRLLDQCAPIAHNPVDELFSNDDHMRAAMLRALTAQDGREDDPDTENEPDGG